MGRTRTELTAYAGILASLAATTLVLAAPWRPLTFAGALVLACVPAGAALMCWIDAGENVAHAALILVVSLAVFAIVSAGMIWLAAWHPQALFALAGVCVVSCSARLRHGAPA